MFKSCQNRGMQIKFENGFTISIQFGTGNYCSRRDYDLPYKNEMSKDFIESQTAEIAIWDESNKWFDFGSDQVKGWCTPDEVGCWIKRTMEASSIETL